MRGKNSSPKSKAQNTENKKPSSNQRINLMVLSFNFKASTIIFHHSPPFYLFISFQFEKIFLPIGNIIRLEICLETVGLMMTALSVVLMHACIVCVFHMLIQWMLLQLDMCVCIADTLIRKSTLAGLFVFPVWLCQFGFQNHYPICRKKYRNDIEMYCITLNHWTYLFASWYNPHLPDEY